MNRDERDAYLDGLEVLCEQLAIDPMGVEIGFMLGAVGTQMTLLGEPIDIQIFTPLVPLFEHLAFARRFEVAKTPTSDPNRVRMIFTPYTAVSA